MASKRTILVTALLTNSWLIAPAAIAQAPVDDLGGTIPAAAPAPAAPVPAATVEVAPVTPAPIAVPAPAAPKAPAKAAPMAVESAEVFIDREDYSLGATERESVPIEIITRNQPKASSANRPAIPAQLPTPSATASSSPSVRIGAINLSNTGASWQPRRQNISTQIPDAASIVQPKNAYFSQKLLQPFNQVSKSLMQAIFPVAVPAPITSLFGWRIHPISGIQKLHTGTDIGAPMGTPVMAAMPGRVILADHLGGYGITVAIEHDNGMRQTLYAHMSELFVRPGDTVQQGTVIGRVGSTGASTGPHLHFELRQMMPDGTWVALDASQHLENSMAKLIQSLQIAQQEQKTAVRPTGPTTPANN